MNLMVCIDGAEHATLELSDGDDVFNQAVERGALDRAYEAKESNPDSVVTIVIDTTPDEADGEAESDLEFIADNLAYLASVDEGENTNSERLWALSKALRHGDITLAGATRDAPIEA